MPLHDTKQFDVLGTTPPRADAYEKVTGRARYTADMHLPDMLYGGGKSAGIASGRIVSIDASRARAIPGVRCVLTPADVKKHVSCSSHRYITDRPRFCGDLVALVAAESPTLVQQALDAIAVQYEEYPAVLTIRDALAPDAPRVRDEYQDNRFTETHYSIRKGDVEAAFARCDVILEREYETQCVEHAYIEPEAALAYHNPADGRITVHCCTQAPYFTRRYIADMLSLPVHQVRVVQETIGGTFGGKEDGVGMLAARTAYLSRITGRPVKWIYSREESIERTGKRHPYLLRYKAGALRNGRIVAWQATQIANAGAYSNHTPIVNWRASMISAGAYDIENVSTDTYGVFTNTPPSGAFRGYSSPQLLYAQEQFIDELAEALGMSEVELRRINRLHDGSLAVTGAPVEHVTLGRVMDLAVEQTGYAQKRRTYTGQTGRLRKGIGMAIAHRGCGFGAESPDATGTMLILNEDGTATVNCALTENGQGMRTAYCMIAAEALGVPYDAVRFYGGDTQTIPDGGITAASRGTAAGAQSVRKAGEALNAVMRRNAVELGYFQKDKWPDAPASVTAEDIVLRHGMFYHKDAPDYQVPLAEVCNAALWSGMQLSSFAWYRPAPFDHDHKTGKGCAFRSYAYGCVIAEVTVDTGTGFVTVDRVTSTHDVGTAVHPELIRGQVYGGIVMGQGFALTEDVELRQGRVSSRNLDSYIIPTALDAPEMQVNIVESDDPNGTYGAKSIGEPAMEMIAPAIANAIYNATGRRLRTNPASLENTLLGKKLTR